MTEINNDLMSVSRMTTITITITTITTTIIIIILRTMFICLQLCHYSLGSPDECRTAPGDRRPMDY